MLFPHRQKTSPLSSAVFLFMAVFTVRVHLLLTCSLNKQVSCDSSPTYIHPDMQCGVSGLSLVCMGLLLTISVEACVLIRLSVAHTWTWPQTDNRGVVALELLSHSSYAHKILDWWDKVRLYWSPSPSDEMKNTPRVIYYDDLKYTVSFVRYKVEST